MRLRQDGQPLPATSSSGGAGRPGAFERAHGGTPLLDEIGELELEPTLLRVLETGQVERVGDDRMILVDVRVVAATYRPLAEEVAAQRFRADLYDRLAVVPGPASPAPAPAHWRRGLAERCGA